MFIRFFFINADVGPQRPVGMSPIARRVDWQFDVAPYQEGSDNEEEITQNLEGLTHCILEYARMGDVPRQYQRHTVGVPTHIHRLLRRLVRAVTCYHEHHRD